ncbi:MAG TPA: ROK family protein [Bryobacteraceae bacterium]|jgi:glucokinase|nr:ROK family protein [Bryobacteraceae bacterium]
MSAGLLLGIDIGGTKTAVVVSDQPPEVIARREFLTRPELGPQQTIEQIIATARELLAGRPIERIGVSCGGPLNSTTGVIQAPPNLSTWVDVPINRILGGAFGVPCALENDANAGAVAEHRFGAGIGTRNMVFLTMGTGLGAGIIANGILYRGACDAAGEIGHVRLTRTGPVGYHKSGSVEGWASGGGLAQAASAVVARADKRGETTLLGGESVSAKDVAEAARAGDRLAKRLIRATGKRLGETLAILVDILNPERIVIGGLAMRMGDDLLAPARAMLRREALPASAAACEVVPAKLNEQIGDLAALCVAAGI